MTKEDPGDVFSQSDSEEVMVEISVEDIPETEAVRAIEEEQSIDDQNPEGATTTEHSKGPDRAIDHNVQMKLLQLHILRAQKAQ